MLGPALDRVQEQDQDWLVREDPFRLLLACPALAPCSGVELSAALPLTAPLPQRNLQLPSGPLSTLSPLVIACLLRRLQVIHPQHLFCGVTPG